MSRPQTQGPGGRGRQDEFLGPGGAGWEVTGAGIGRVLRARGTAQTCRKRPGWLDKCAQQEAWHQEGGEGGGSRMVGLWPLASGSQMPKLTAPGGPNTPFMTLPRERGQGRGIRPHSRIQDLESDGRGRHAPEAESQALNGETRPSQAGSPSRESLPRLGSSKKYRHRKAPDSWTAVV